MTDTRNTRHNTVTSGFVTTRWTRVLEAKGESPEAKSALGELCAAYYAPVFGFIRRKCADEESARDLTQEFFSRVLAGRGIDNADARRGRFRSFLLGAVKHFLSDRRDRDQRLKRGFGKAHCFIEAGTDTDVEMQVADVNAPNPEREFDRKWALTLLDRALQSVQQEHETAGKSAHFEAIKPWLTGDNEDHPQAKIGKELGLSENTVKVAIHRLRRRFRQAIKGEILQTVGRADLVEEELRSLFEALS